MLAASEEFLREIAPDIDDDGTLHEIHMVVSAVNAGSRLVLSCVSPSILGVASSSPIYWLVDYCDLTRGENTASPGWGRYQAIRAKNDGMPFVGWSINAESRRIDGPAQPGEGDFIKYLGRDPAPEEIGPCNFNRE